MLPAKSNPLSTRFVQPGRIDWQFFDERFSVDRLANYFTYQLNRRAAIVGPHGSGKSTLLEHLVPQLGTIVSKRAAFESRDSRDDSPLSNPEPPGVAQPIVWLRMRGAKESSALLRQTRPTWQKQNSLLVIDGYEQLPLLARARLIFRTRSQQVGLLLTSHRDTCLPTLVRTSVDAAMARRLLDQLLPPDTPRREQYLDTARLDKLLQAHRGNLRELFMQLYDELEH